LGEDEEGGEEIVRMPRRLGTEFFGTLWLVLGGCGGVVLAAAFAQS